MRKILEYTRNRFHPLHRLRKMRWFREKILPALDVDVAVKGEFAQPIYVKAITHSSYYLAGGAVEPLAKKVFLELVKSLPSGALLLDVGANIGAYTWLAAGARPDLQVLAFEPDPENFRLLSKTAKTWKAQHVKLLPMGVSHEEGVAIFTRDTITSATGSLESAEAFAQRHFKTKGETIKVAITTLDAACIVAGTPALIKIDVEGHEEKVFQGAWQVITKNHPVLFFESFGRSKGFLATLKEHGYLLFDTDHSGCATDLTVNYLAVPAGSKYAEIARTHLLPS